MARRGASPQGGPRVVDVYDWGKDYLDIERVNACGPTIKPRAISVCYAKAPYHMMPEAEHFGSAPTGYDGTCYFGPLQDPVPMDAGAWDDAAPPIWRTADWVRSWYDSA